MDSQQFHTITSLSFTYWNLHYFSSYELFCLMYSKTSRKFSYFRFVCIADSISDNTQVSDIKLAKQYSLKASYFYLSSTFYEIDLDQT